MDIEKEERCFSQKKTFLIVCECRFGFNFFFNLKVCFSGSYLSPIFNLNLNYAQITPFDRTGPSELVEKKRKENQIINSVIANRP